MRCAKVASLIGGLVVSARLLVVGRLGTALIMDGLAGSVSLFSAVRIGLAVLQVAALSLRYAHGSLLRGGFAQHAQRILMRGRIVAVVVHVGRCFSAGVVGPAPSVIPRRAVRPCTLSHNVRLVMRLRGVR